MKNYVITIIAAVCAAAFAAWGGYVFCTTTHIENAGLSSLIPFYIILVLLGVFAEECVHEGAHFLVGCICRMGVKIPKIRFFRSSFVEVYPIGQKCMKARFIATGVAGLVFDLLLVALGIIAFIYDGVPAAVGIASPYALYSFIINACLFEYRQGKTDGLAVWEVILNKPTAQVMLTILRVQGLLRSGVLMSEIDEGLLLDVPQLQEDDLNFIILTQLRYEYYLAKGNDSEAYKYFVRFQQLVEYLPSEIKEKDVRGSFESEL